MADVLDIGYNFQRMLNGIRTSAEEIKELEKEVAAKKCDRRGPVDPNAFLKVRESVCVVGYDRESVTLMKNQVGRLQEEPFPIEGFHVKNPSDLKDGALLVPKLILVARHCPGRKLLDDDSDEGQLDDLYDEAVEMKADVMVIYIDLPRAIYKPMRHIVYHPKLAETVFPTQPLLRRLASDNCFITLTEQAELNSMQKNVIREWLTKPVNAEHPVYKVADQLSSAELTRSGNFDFSKVKMASPMKYYDPSHSSTTGGFAPYNRDPEIYFQPATEEHPLADKKKKKSRKEKKEKRHKNTRKRELGTLQELVDDPEPGVEMNTMGKTNLSFTSGQAFDNFV